jgi:carbon-monoxide dehydrogenase medium subunit
MIAEHYKASSVQEALAYLATHRGRAQLVAGGSQLMPLVESGEAMAACLVDISGICILRRVAQEDGHLVMGSVVTFQMMADHPLVHSEAPLLVEAIQKTSVAVQPDVATLGGAVATARGTSEISVALVTLDAEAQITNLTGSQWLPLSCLLAKSGSSRVDSTSEIVTALRCVPSIKGQGAAMGRIQPSRAGDCAPLILALMLGLDAARTIIEWVSVVTSFVHGAPVHLSVIEKTLKGMAADDPGVRRTLIDLLPDQIVARGIAESTLPDSDSRSIVDLALDCYDRALQQALAN